MFIDQIQQEIQERVELGYAQNVVATHLTEDSTQVFQAGSFSSLPEDTVFEIGSITKVFTAHLAVILEKEGVLSLDNPIQAYLPEVEFPIYSKETPITLRHLLTHTSGLKDPEVENYYNKKNGNTVPVADYMLEDVSQYLPDCC
jgi:CubicO group peptidase (beta-lactamase class C family)